MKIRTSTGKAKEQADEGTHLAGLMSIVDLGHRPEWMYQGKPVPSSWKLEFTYELVNHLMKDGKPFVISEEITNNDWEDVKSGKRTTLVSRCRSLLGDRYREGIANPSSMLGLPCMVSVETNDRGYSRLRGQAAVGSVPFGMATAELANKTYTFDMDNPDMEIWHSMPEFKQTKIQEALNFKDSPLYKLLEEESEY